MNGPSKLSQLPDKPQSAPANYNSGGYKAPQSSSYSTETSHPGSTGYNQPQFGATSSGGQFAQQNYSQMPSSLQTTSVSIHSPRVSYALNLRILAIFSLFLLCVACPMISSIFCISISHCSQLLTQYSQGPSYGGPQAQGLGQSASGTDDSFCAQRL